jgi:hypothetical protein
MQNRIIALACCSALREDCRALELFVRAKGDDPQHPDFDAIVWTSPLDEMGEVELRDEFVRSRDTADLLILLLGPTANPAVGAALDVALHLPQAAGATPVAVFFKDDGSGPGAGGGQTSAWQAAFGQRITSLNHRWLAYQDTNGLQSQFAQLLQALAWDKTTTPAAGRGSGDATYSASVHGSGALAQGPGATALGSGAVLVQGNNTGSINVTVAPVHPWRGPPFQAPTPAPDHVPRPIELARIKQHFLDENGGLRPVTVGLHGFGGAGKTTLARLFCADPAVRSACADGILWVPLGKNPPDPRAQIADLVAALTGQSGGCNTLPGARAQLQAALAGKRVLLVVDDVWDEAHVREIAEACTHAARLITTRNVETLPFDAVLIDVETMREEDAITMLQAGLPPGQEGRVAALARQLGRWPVLLRLANRTLRQRTLRQKMALPKALDVVERDLARKGVRAFDPARETLERDQAVSATVEASLELLDQAERARYAELAIFPQDVPIPLENAGELWRLTAAVAPDQAESLVATLLEPLSLVDYDAAGATVQLHDVLRSYLEATLPNRAALHQRLADHWGDYPDKKSAYAWRWLAFHRAEAARLAAPPDQHRRTAALVELVTREDWQSAHEAAIGDLPALREALSAALGAAVADDDPRGLAPLVQAADALTGFGGRHLRPETVFALARQGDLEGARRRSDLFFIDEHWRQALLLSLLWLAPPAQRDEARRLWDEIRTTLAPQPALKNLLAWVGAELFAAPPPRFAAPALAGPADEPLIEALLKRVGGGEYDHELILSRGLDPDLQNPDAGPPPTRGIYRDTAPAGPDGPSAETQTKTGYLVELDGPCLIAYAAEEPARGLDALQRYLSVYTNYNYPEYRFSTLWLLLGHVAAFPRPDAGQWVKDAVERILASALGGGSVEFQQGLPTAALALRARAHDPAARESLMRQAHELAAEVSRLKPGRDRAGSDIWAHHKRRLLAYAQALGWLLGEGDTARQLLDEALALADSGFAGYQAPACLAVAEAILVVGEGDPAVWPQIENALELAQRAAHNVQDPSFCARMTARVHAMRKTWWQPLDLEERALQLATAAYRPEFAALHRVGHAYAGRRMDALQFPHWASDQSSLEALQRLYQRSKADFLRLNGAERPLRNGDEVAVPDPGFVPHLAARLAAEALAQAGGMPLDAERLRLLRGLVPFAIPSPTALDAVLARLVLAVARPEPGPAPAEAVALEAVLARRPPEQADDQPLAELTAVPLPGGLPS